ncbi:MAG: MMPL family transporter, partial [Polyangiaceae bacterium]|nr:MMPL family transporter [Polyangiaceae bacterium]
MTEKNTPVPLRRLGELQARYPWHFVTLALFSLLPAIWAIVGGKGLGFKSDFAELLPDNKPSVIEMHRVSERLAGAATLSVVAETRDHPNPEALKGFVDALVPALQALGPKKVGAVDYGVQDTLGFFDQNKLLYADINDLRKAHTQVLERYDYEIAKQRGDLIDDDDPPPPLTAASIEERIRGSKGEVETEAGEKYPDGYYMNAEGNFIAVLIRTPVSGKEAKAAFLKEIESVVASVNPKRFDPTIDVNFTGNFITSAEEYDAIISDLRHVGGWGLAGVLASVFVFFMRGRTLLAMGATIVVALLWTFGLTRFTIGHLNSSTGFLVSIIAGNGINYGIMYMARYIEARRDDASDVPTAIQLAHRDSWLPTLAGSATAMLAYGSLVLTDFRGFKHFGVISGYGMIICWIVTYAFLPAMLAASERVVPSFQVAVSVRQRSAAVRAFRVALAAAHRVLDRLPRGFYGVAFAKLARAYPRTVAVVGVALGIGAAAASVQYLLDDPTEYDMANVRNERRDRTAAGLLSVRVDKVVGRMGQDGMAIMTDRLDQVPLLEAELQKRYD